MDQGIGSLWSSLQNLVCVAIASLVRDTQSAMQQVEMGVIRERTLRVIIQL